MFLLYFFQARYREVQRLVPRRFAESLRRAHQGVEQAIGVPALHVALYAFRTEHAVVEGKLFPWFESDDLIAANFQLNSALLATETTMSFDQMVGRISRFILPTSRRSVRRVWARNYRAAIRWNSVP